MSLHKIQQKIHVAKDKRNTFGKYNYRTAEGILSAVKSIMIDGETIVLSDEIKDVAGQIFVSAKAQINFTDGSSASAYGHAMHSLEKKGMDAAQITGSASSYARKYALCGLLAIDDSTVDPDATNGNVNEPMTPEPFNSPPTKRDGMKKAISGQTDLATLEKLWGQTNFKDAFGKLPDPMKAELTKAYTDKQGELSPDEIPY